MILSAFFSLAMLLSSSVAQAKKSVVDYVSTLVGTQSSYALSTGNTYPAIALPWGMNFWMPQTGKMGDGWAYTYTADKIRGFKQTHQPNASLMKTNELLGSHIKQSRQHLIIIRFTSLIMTLPLRLRQQNVQPYFDLHSLRMMLRM